MVSEKKLCYYEYVAQQTCNEECQKIILQLTSEVRKLKADVNSLNAEANWLADRMECDMPPWDNCAMQSDEGEDVAVCIKCLREQARRSCHD